MRKSSLFFSLMCVLFLGLSSLWPQVKYRTFSQDDLASKKNEKSGKRIASIATFTFHNDSAYTVNSLHAKFNSEIEAIIDSGGFTTFTIDGHQLNASGRSVSGLDSTVLTIRFHKKDGDIDAEKWYWDTSGTRIGPTFKELGADGPIIRVLGQPNGGNVRDFLYKKIIHAQGGLYAGEKTDTPGVGWILYMTADRKYFPHAGTPRCLDSIVNGTGGKKAFVGQLRNPHVNKHDNHLVGELHAMKLAIIANDSGVTEPVDGGTTLFGDLLYNDTVNTGDNCNGKTIRELAHLADSALTYCTHFSGSTYTDLDACISRINAAFGGPYTAVTFSPFLLAGTHTLAEEYFLRPNPAAAPIMSRHNNYSLLEQPEKFTIAQNYPNPFNPSTTIEFYLSEPALVTLKVYNVIGQEVATVLNSESMEEGNQIIEFSGNDLPSGVYFYRISAQGTGDFHQQFNAIKKMVLLK